MAWWYELDLLTLVEAELGILEARAGINGPKDILGALPPKLVGDGKLSLATLIKVDLANLANVLIFYVVAVDDFPTFFVIAVGADVQRVSILLWALKPDENLVVCPLNLSIINNRIDNGSSNRSLAVCAVALMNRFMNYYESFYELWILCFAQQSARLLLTTRKLAILSYAHRERLAPASTQNLLSQCVCTT